jgi:polyketide cyclase/dehydrase/lipid transport protein
MRIEESIVIKRSPHDVFAFLAVRDNDPVWMAAVVESEWLDPSARLGVGRRGRMAMKMFGRRTEYVGEVTAYEHGRRIAHRTVEGPFQLNTACLCEPAGDPCRTAQALPSHAMPSACRPTTREASAAAYGPPTAAWEPGPPGSSRPLWCAIAVVLAHQDGALAGRPKQVSQTLERRRLLTCR